MIGKDLYEPLEVGVSTIPVRYENVNPANHVLVGDIGQTSLAARKKFPEFHTACGCVIILVCLGIPGFWIVSSNTPNVTITTCLCTLAFIALGLGLGSLCGYCNRWRYTGTNPKYGEEEDSSPHVKDVEMGESLPTELADRGVAADDLPVSVPEAVVSPPGESVESAVMVDMDEDPSSPVMVAMDEGPPPVADTIVMLPSGIEIVRTHSP